MVRGTGLENARRQSHRVPPPSQTVRICWLQHWLPCCSVPRDPSGSREDCVQDWVQVTGLYKRATYAKEMREALERWADHVEAIPG
jgi:hypothetical protein